jgi:hypothetical protein
MSFKHHSLAVAAAVLSVAVGSASASAQGSCADMYNRVMWSYQNQGAQSPQYAAMANHYSARCLAGPEAAASPYGYQAYESYQTPYTYQTPYAYQQPVNPAVAVLGGMAGGALVGALDDDRGWNRHRDGWRRGW